MFILCFGFFRVFGWRGIGFVIEFLDGKCFFKFFMFIECVELLNNWEEILFFCVVKGYFYFEDILDKIFDLLENVEIEFFIGRDFIDVYIV